MKNGFVGLRVEADGVQYSEYFESLTGTIEIYIHRGDYSIGWELVARFRPQTFNEIKDQ